MTARYRAFLAGNAEYPKDRGNLRRLEGPPYDVPLLWQALVDPDRGLFARADVAIRNELTSTDLLRDLKEFFDAARSEDVLLFYHSGHGLRASDGLLHLCTRDTVTGRLSTTSISSDQLNELIDNSAARLTVVVLDCCHSGAFRSGHIVEPIGGRGRYVLASCRGSELAGDVSKLNHASHFTETLAAGLLGEAGTARTSGRLTLDELYDYVYDRMTALGQQTPQRSVHGEGQMAIARIVSAPARPARLDPPVRRHTGRRRGLVAVASALSLIVVLAAAVLTATLAERGSTGNRPARASSPTAGPSQRTASAPHPEPPWYPTEPVEPGTPTPSLVMVVAPADGADVDGPCLPVTGTSTIPAGDTLIIASRNVDGPPGQPFIYTLVAGWNKPGTLADWHASLALGTAGGQRYELAVLVADRTVVRAAWPATKGIATSSNVSIPGLRLAAMVTVMQRTAAGPPCGA